MRRISSCLLVMVLLVSCRAKQPQVDKTLDNGVEVVINHLSPYKISREPSQLRLEEKTRIDFGTKEFEKFGLKEPTFVEADSDGNVYVAEEDGAFDYFINKFDQNGKCLARFGRPGQGPGEIQRIYGINIDSHDQIFVSDIRNAKIIEFAKSGEFVREMRAPLGLGGVIPLENGNIIVLRSSDKGYELSVVDSISKIKEIGSFDLSESRKGAKTTGTLPPFFWRATSDRIYVGNGQRGYEIWMFDLDGNLLKKIRKDYEVVKYPREFIEQTKQMIEHGSPVVVMENTPPFNSFFIDGDRRLFVMTYEKGKGNDEYIHDIFDSEGIFIGRKSLKLFGILGRGLNHRWAVAKNGCYYCLNYKRESDYPELITYQMIWK
jgi:hypothetical protein